MDALERDNFMDPEQAKEWGLIDEIVEKSRPAAEGEKKPDPASTDHRPGTSGNWPIVVAPGLI